MEQALILSQQRYINELEHRLTDKEIWKYFAKKFVRDLIEKLEYKESHDHNGYVYDGNGKSIRFYKNHIEISDIDYNKEFYYDPCSITKNYYDPYNSKKNYYEKVSEADWLIKIHTVLTENY